MTWTVELTAAARKSLLKLPREAQSRIVLALATLAEDPLRGGNVKRLSGRSELRLRVGDYRILYDLERDVLVVRVVHMGHRREVYR